MSNLINKQVKKIDRIQTVMPTNTYDSNNVYTVTPEVQEQNSVVDTKSKVKEKTTSVRCSFRNKDRLNAHVIFSGVDSVDQLLDILLDEHEAVMTQEQRRELRTVLDIYTKKRK